MSTACRLRTKVGRKAAVHQIWPKPASEASACMLCTAIGSRSVGRTNRPTATEEAFLCHGDRKRPLSPRQKPSPLHTPLGHTLSARSVGSRTNHRMMGIDPESDKRPNKAGEKTLHVPRKKRKEKTNTAETDNFQTPTKSAGMHVQVQYSSMYGGAGGAPPRGIPASLNTRCLSGRNFLYNALRECKTMKPLKGEEEGRGRLLVQVLRHITALMVWLLLSAIALRHACTKFHRGKLRDIDIARKEGRWCTPNTRHMFVLLMVLARLLTFRALRAADEDQADGDRGGRKCDESGETRAGHHHHLLGGGGVEANGFCM